MTGDDAGFGLKEAPSMMGHGGLGGEGREGVASMGGPRPPHFPTNLHFVMPGSHGYVMILL